MKATGRRILNISAVVILFVAGGLIFLPRIAYPRQQSFRGSLESVIPSEAAGWESRELEVAESPEIKNRVMGILRYDEIFYRSYRRGTLEVQVYVAYWKPGTVPYGQAGVHTPDTCWVTNGWKQEMRRYGEPLSVGRETTKPAEIGHFSFQGHSTGVVFWHLVGGRVHSYRQYNWYDGFAGIRQRLPHLFEDLRRYGLNLAQEQLFIRLSSNRSIDSLLSEPNFHELLGLLRPLGIFEPQL